MLLIDAGHYERYVSLASVRAFDEQAIEAARADEMGEIKVVGTDALIPITGPLSYKYDFWTWWMDGTSYQGLQAQLAAADKNNMVQRIILYMDTPGGEITGLPETARMIASMSKDVVAYVDPCCASAGLWLASQAKKIVCMETGEIGSLGVQLEYRSYAEYFKKAGIDVKVFRADISPDKNLAHPYEPLTEEASEYLQERVNTWGERFVATVASGRKKSVEHVLENFGKGRMLYGPEALKVGLVDAVGTLEDILAEQPRATKKTALYRKTVDAYRAS